VRGQTRPATDEISMRCKDSFYFSRRSLVVGRWPVTRDLANDERPSADSYPGLSRCTTFTRYPALRKCLLTSSAIITDRCCPPVQPNEIVR
jgi:hypothetical protein